jgi:hypothetical protein
VQQFYTAHLAEGQADKLVPGMGMAACDAGGWQSGINPAYCATVNGPQFPEEGFAVSSTYSSICPAEGHLADGVNGVPSGWSPNRQLYSS